jgi:hypothetical protein
MTWPGVQPRQEGVVRHPRRPPFEQLEHRALDLVRANRPWREYLPWQQYFIITEEWYRHFQQNERVWEHAQLAQLVEWTQWEITNEMRLRTDREDHNSTAMGVITMPHGCRDVNGVVRRLELLETARRYLLSDDFGCLVAEATEDELRGEMLPYLARPEGGEGPPMETIAEWVYGFAVHTPQV